MPRKPKASPPAPAGDGSVSGIAGTFPETVAGLAVVYSMVSDLVGDALREANAAAPLPPEMDDPAGQMVGYIRGAGELLVRASVAAGILPEEAIAGMEEVMETADEK